MDSENKEFTRSMGGRVYDDQNSITTYGNEYTIMSDAHLFEKMAHFNRERIPERIVHAKGGGAHGVFTLTRDMSEFTDADMFCGVGKQTEMLARFSTVSGERGSADTKRDPRGFALKFYTREGNYDIVCNDTPVFFVRDAIKFPDFIHSQKRNPVTNLPDMNAYWDFLSLTPESMHQVMRLMSDNGTPDGFRHMDGFGNHTFMWYKKDGSYVWVKYTFKSLQGIKNLTDKEAVRLAGENPDYAVQDLYDHIKAGDFPAWDMYVQILTPEQAKEYRYDIFEVTKEIYEEDYPLIKVGRFVLNRIPTDFFTEIEQAAFCPGNMVNGIGPSPDKMLNARMVFYSDTQRYRLGVNFEQLPTNKPKNMVMNYQRDGKMAVDNPKQPFPNYFPNSFGGVKPNPTGTPPPIYTCGYVKNYPMPVKPIDFEQPRRFYETMTEKEKMNTVNNICGSLGQAIERIQYRQCALFFITSPDLGAKVANQLGLNLNKVIYLAGLSQEERVKRTSAREWLKIHTWKVFDIVIKY